MTRCLFAADLHGHVDRYEKLFVEIERASPDVVFLGGDLLPGPLMAYSSVVGHQDFLNDYVASNLLRLRDTMGSTYPRILLILGNDDGKAEESAVLDIASRGLWTYIHDRRVRLGLHTVYGYAYVPPSPFRLKDWERYDVSHYVDPGCVSPEEGAHSVPVSAHEIRYATIDKDLVRLTENDDLSNAVLLFHSPPYQTKLDRAALDGKTVEHVPLDVHVGSIAIRRLIEARQPLLTLHGHVHESARLTGTWKDAIGRTFMFTAAHDGPELALVRFDLDELSTAERDLL